MDLYNMEKISPKTRVTVIIPTYNEAENAPLITKAILGLNIEGLDILIADDDSPDGTGKIVDELSRSFPRKIYLLSRHGPRGLGAAYIDGFNWAFEHGSNYIIQMDADFSHSPEYISQMLETIPDYDLVIGSRYVSGGRLDERWGWHRKFLSWWANSVWVRFLLGLRTHDATSGFRCWNTDALKKINLGEIRSNGYAFLVEMCYLAEKSGLKIKEIPIYFRERDLGDSKMSLKEQIQSASRVLEIRQRYRKTN